MTKEAPQTEVQEGLQQASEEICVCWGVLAWTSLRIKVLRISIYIMEEKWANGFQNSTNRQFILLYTSAAI